MAMYVIMIAASTICGRISPVPVGSSRDRALLEKMRDETDASLMGAGTLRYADPQMLGSGGRLRPDRLRAIVSGTGEIPSDRLLFADQTNVPLIFTGREQAGKVAAGLGSRAEVIVLPTGPGGLSIAAAISKLGKRGAKRILIEGGGGLNYAALHEGLVNEIRLTICPKISGDSAAAMLAFGPEPLGQTFMDLVLTDLEKSPHDEIFATYMVRR